MPSHAQPPAATPYGTVCVGRITELWRYPVKSMLGERLESLSCDSRGIVGDRVFAVRNAEGKFGSGKNTRRFRKIDGLLAFQAEYDGDHVQVRFPDGQRARASEAHIHDSLTRALGQPVTLARETDTSHLDAAPIHLLTTASLRWLQAALPAAAIDALRFRPNLVIDVAGEGPLEQAWIGKRLRVGNTVELLVTEATELCGMIAFAQSDLAEVPSVLRYVTQHADLKFGVYARVVTPGRIHVGYNAMLCV